MGTANELLSLLERLVEELQRELHDEKQASGEAAASGRERQERLDLLASEFTEFGQRLASGRRSGSDQAPLAVQLRQLVDEVEASRSRIGAIRSASRLLAVSEQWFLALVGEARAESGGPSWEEIGGALSGLDPFEGVVSCRISRQGARQRFDKSVVVKVYRLRRVEQVLEDELISAAQEGERLVRGASFTSLARRVKEAMALVVTVQEVEMRLGEVQEELHELMRFPPGQTRYEGNSSRWYSVYDFPSTGR